MEYIRNMFWKGKVSTSNETVNFCLIASLNDFRGVTAVSYSKVNAFLQWRVSFTSMLQNYVREGGAISISPKLKFSASDFVVNDAFHKLKVVV